MGRVLSKIRQQQKLQFETPSSIRGVLIFLEELSYLIPYVFRQEKAAIKTERVLRGCQGVSTIFCNTLSV